MKKKSKIEAKSEINLGLTSAALRSHLELFFAEDDLLRNFHYTCSLPNKPVQCLLKIKSPMLLTGMPFFIETFLFLDPHCLSLKEQQHLLSFEGKTWDKKEISFKLPFNVALTGERIALNLLQRSSSISSTTNKFVDIVKKEKKDIAILDTRKTTPGFRFLEKYAVRQGGGKNHRFGQTDLWMIKDNHKNFFKGMEKAISFFNSQGAFYNSLEVEIHSLDEFHKAQALGVKHLMLDNFTPGEIATIVKFKKAGTTIEVSGGVTFLNIKNYLIEGVDAISIGSLTYGAAPVDLSMKMKS